MVSVFILKIFVLWVLSFVTKLNSIFEIKLHCKDEKLHRKVSKELKSLNNSKTCCLINTHIFSIIQYMKKLNDSFGYQLLLWAQLLETHASIFFKWISSIRNCFRRIKIELNCRQQNDHSFVPTSSLEMNKHENYIAFVRSHIKIVKTSSNNRSWQQVLK